MPKRLQKTQVAAFPIRISDEGQVFVLLVTSRETKRWVLPKGWPSKKMSDSKAASREALQEAGITGKIERKPFGYYRYRKALPGKFKMIDVAVYALWVRKQRQHWPEENERTRVWASLSDAARLVREPGLKKLLNEMAEQLPNEISNRLETAKLKGQI